MASLREVEISSGGDPSGVTAPFPPEIERIPASEISYEQFFARFMQSNTAVILTSVADHWECYRRWVVRRQRDDGDDVDKVDVAYLKAQIGNVIVPVADCSKQYYNAHEKLEMDFGEFLNYWAGADRGDRKLYLKDWHLRESAPEYEFYETPIFFASDWLNEFLVDRNRNDYMFVYIGPKGSWTSFHADVFSSYSWSTNIFGVKKWLLLAPGEEDKLRDRLGNFPFEISDQLLQDKDVHYYKILQTPGEAIFVPSGWYHQVENVEDAISVNHNWFNGCNIAKIWDGLEQAFEQVVKEIEDCRDMDNFDEHCQLMLKASYGMDVAGFLEILTHICDKRVAALGQQSIDVIQFGTYRLGRNHIRFDLEAIRRVLDRMLSKREMLETVQLLTKVLTCLETINNAID